jgi:hypothetical protein
LEVRYVLAIVAALGIAVPLAFAGEAVPPSDTSEPHDVSPVETHMKGDLNAMEAKMHMLMQRHDQMHVEIDRLQKRIDGHKATVDKLAK